MSFGPGGTFRSEAGRGGRVRCHVRGYRKVAGPIAAREMLCELLAADQAQSARWYSSASAGVTPGAVRASSRSVTSYGLAVDPLVVTRAILALPRELRWRGSRFGAHAS
jgi:hypothetical protein